MATATDFAAGLGATGFVPYELMEGTQAILYNVMSEMTDVSPQTDTFASGAVQLVTDSAEYVSFSEPTDSMGTTVHEEVGGASQEGFDSVPRIYKMRGWSTTLGQYVFWRSVGDPFVPAPSEYGNVINVTSELIA